MSQLLQYYKSFQQSRNPSPPSAPTFEDLAIDDNLSELQRLLKYSKSSIGLQRLVNVKMIASIATSVGFIEAKDKIIPLLDSLSRDTETAVKQHFVEQLDPLAKFCCLDGKDEGYNLTISQILPIIARLLEDDKTEVRQAACVTLVSISQLMQNEDLGQYILTIILRLSHEDDKEEMRMTACELLNSLAECFGNDLVRQFVIPEIVSLAEDPVFRVRKATALNFHNICKVGGEHELFERLMPAFVRLSKDDVYRVRKACGESLSEISKYVSDDIRIGVLVEIFLRLIQDSSRVVKQSVLQQAGMFISSLPEKYITDVILSHYISLSGTPTGDMAVDAELRHYCAFSFPAVLQTIGRKRWGEIRGLFHALIQCRSTPVRQTLAASLHQVARLLEEESLVEEELVPVFEELIQDVEVVQIGVIKYLSLFLKALSEPCRRSYLPLLHDILHSTNPFNWRLRMILAKQLPDLILLPLKSDLYSSLFPLVMTLLQDPVASVRRDSYIGLAKMLLILAELYDPYGTSDDGDGDGDEKKSSEPSQDKRDAADKWYDVGEQQSHLSTIITAINALVTSETYQLRQLWLELCHSLLLELPKDFFELHFIDGILQLSSDSVCNVRVAAAALLSCWRDCELGQRPWYRPAPLGRPTVLSDDVTHIPSPWSWLLQRRDVQQCVGRLAQDDRDVYLNISKLKPLFPQIQFKSISVRGLKRAPGGQDPVENQSSPEAADSVPAEADQIPPHLSVDCDHDDSLGDLDHVNGSFSSITSSEGDNDRQMKNSPSPSGQMWAELLTDKIQDDNKIAINSSSLSNSLVEDETV